MIWGANMKLTKLKVFNYRSFGNEEQIVPINELTTFIGSNSTGKTAALCALNCIFSTNSNDRVLQRSDFHLPKDTKPDELEKQELYIEAIFTFEELKEDGKKGKYSIPPFFQSMVVGGEGEVPYLRIRLEATWEKSNNVDGSIESRVMYITCPEGAEVKDEHKPTANRRELDCIRVIYVPAVRDPSRQLKNVSGTMMHQIMSSINWSDEIKNNVEGKIRELNEEFKHEKGVSILDSAIHTQWQTYDSDYRYSNAQLRFNSTDIESSIKKSEVVFLPTVTGKEYTIDEMGDGLRSLFYISMVDSILDVEVKIQEELETNPENTSFTSTPPVLTIIALEEPENHIAPHLMGKLIKNLINIAKKTNAQTIMTSHAPAIIKRINPENLRYFRMNAEFFNTEVRSITLPDKEKLSDQYKYIKEAVKAYPELYFAKLVILGEGDSEEIILPKFIEAYGNNIDSSGISVVPLGGRHVNHFWRLLMDLRIPHITLLDLDRERDGGGWGRIKYAIEQLIKNGVPKSELLQIKGGLMSDEQFSQMDSWDVTDTKTMQSWIDMLENHNVFYSTPLDIDFLMLENLGENYILLLDKNEGPRIEIERDGVKTRVNIQDIDEGMFTDELQMRISKDVSNTLKECGGDGKTYTEEQKKWMMWYNYFFLNRGKPSTHIAVLSQMSDEDFRMNTPSIIQRIIKRIEELLGKEEVKITQ